VIIIDEASYGKAAPLAIDLAMAKKSE